MPNTPQRTLLKVILSPCHPVIGSPLQLFRFFLLSACFFLLLAACTAPTPTLPATIAITPTPTLAPTETAPPVVPTQISASAPPASAPVKIYYAGLSLASEVVQRTAQKFGWQFEQTPEASPDTIRAAAQSGAQIIIVGGEELQEAARAIAPEFPQVYFIGFGLSGDDPPPNMLALGGPESREDQAGFLAGMAAGFATENKYVTAIRDPNSVEGRKYGNGFLHGVRYACPKCRVEFIDMGDTSDAETTGAEAARYVLFGSDVFFAAAGEAGEAALVAAAQKGGWVIGSGSDVYLSLFGGGSIAGADRVLTSVYLDTGEAVRAALTAFHDGTPRYGAHPLSAASGAVVLAPIRDAAGLLSLPDQADIATALARLADGSLETGIDPVTGEEK